jgi:hypothetical protein
MTRVAVAGVGMAGVLVTPAAFVAGFLAGVTVADRWNRALHP